LSVLLGFVTLRYRITINNNITGHTKRCRDDGTIIRSKWTVAHCPGHGPSPDDGGTVWAVVDDGQSCCLHNKRTLLPPRHLFSVCW